MSLRAIWNLSYRAASVGGTAAEQWDGSAPAGGEFDQPAPRLASGVALRTDSSRIAADIDWAWESISKGKCVLFLGAAVHAPPPAGSGFVYPDSERPLSAKELAQKLFEACDPELVRGEDARNLARIAGFYQMQRNRAALVDAIAKEVQTGKKPSPLLRVLAEFDFPIVATTNYDSMFEVALRAIGKEPQVVSYRPNDSLAPEGVRYSVTRPLVFKAHGDLSSPANRTGVVVTDDDYIKFLLRMSEKRATNPVPLKLRRHMKEWPTLFLGYSMKDYNLRVLFRGLRTHIDEANYPTMFNVDTDPDPILRNIWGARGGWVTFIVQDVWDFVFELSRRAGKTVTLS